MIKTKEELLAMEEWTAHEDCFFPDIEGVNWWPVFAHPSLISSYKFLVVKCPSYEEATMILDLFHFFKSQQ